MDTSKKILLYDFKQNVWHFRNAKQKKKNTLLKYKQNDPVEPLKIVNIFQNEDDLISLYKNSLRILFI